MPEEDDGEYSDFEDEYQAFFRKKQMAKKAAKMLRDSKKKAAETKSAETKVGPKPDWSAIDKQEDASAADKAAAAAYKAAAAELTKKAKEKGKRRVRLSEGEYVRRLDLEDLHRHASSPPPT